MLVAIGTLPRDPVRRWEDLELVFPIKLIFDGPMNFRIVGIDGEDTESKCNDKHFR